MLWRGLLRRRFLGPVDCEYFVVLLLDRKNRLIGINTVSMGSLTASAEPSKFEAKKSPKANSLAGCFYSSQ